MGTVSSFPRRAKGSGVAFEPPPEVAALKAELAALKAKVPPPKESASQIAARIRSGMGPTSPIVQRCLERRADGEEVWI